MTVLEDVALKDPGVPNWFWIIKGNNHLKEHLSVVFALDVDRACAGLAPVAARGWTRRWARRARGGGVEMIADG